MLYQVVLPALVGLLTGGAFIVASRVLAARRERPVIEAPPEKKTPEHDPFVHGSKSERRAGPRRGGNPVAIYYQPLERKGQPLEGWVRDRSVGGMCIILHEQFAAGTFLRLLPVSAPDTTPWVDVEVRSCRKQGDGYELGCQFVKQPPWGVLLLFG
jgi:hypothetical protein